ncbi:MAG: phage replisome organizer N-terminal domain-containing protein [Anaerococcus sp.]|uniref:phage replisome organizer N-terminal domain-containing protein n=1 Tax=Anaerococcus sp. TaxID=1872515 RepID=UPI002915200E|nr:phage replisome organizer N-terminal domain-containing protein [Anaerococcus sp.]MDU4026571.1 phage replisome organizer N-terminal domain-containing protein [Anaerococcus sp.]
MAGISWIKLSVNIFDDEKIKLIKSMPEGDAIILIWIQLLCLAGKTNDNGAVYIGQHMNYTDEMISTICNQPLNTVRLALKTFEQFEMINLDEDGLISIANWEKHQNIEGMEKVRAQTRKRVAKYRAKQKELESSNANVTLRNGTDKNRIDKNKNRLDIDKNTNNSHVDDEDFKTQIIDTWNSLDKNIPRIQTLNTNTQRYQMLRARINEHGLDTVIKAIKSIDQSKFLKGYVSDFRITIDWFIKPNNFIKVLEGNYNDKKQATKLIDTEKSYTREARTRRFLRMMNER